MWKWLKRLFGKTDSGNAVVLKPVFRMSAKVWREKTQTWEDAPNVTIRTG